MGKFTSAFRMNAIRCIVIVLVTLAAVCGGSASAQAPTLPHAFFGSVEIAGNAAPAGTQIEVRGTGVLIGIPGNPIFTTEAGMYGGPSAFDVKLVVQGSIAEGATLEFFINGVKAECAEPGGAWQQTFAFTPGAVTELRLRVNQTAPPVATPTATPTSTPTQTPAPAATSTPSPTGSGASTNPPTATRSSTSTAGVPATVAPITAPASSVGASSATATLSPAVTPALKALVSTPTSLAGLMSPTETRVPPTSEPPTPSQAPTATPQASAPTANPTVTPTPKAARPTSKPILVASSVLSTPQSSEADVTSQPIPRPQEWFSNPWFLGVLGVAVIGLSFGGIVAYQRKRRKA